MLIVVAMKMCEQAPVPKKEASRQIREEELHNFCPPPNTLTELLNRSDTLV
jgi:hypothetical protein